MPGFDKVETRRKNLIIFITILALLAVAGTLLFIFPSAIVIGESMEPNYHDGDILIGCRVLPIERDNVVIIRKEPVLIKRVIGLPGETVYILGREIFINGVLYENDYEINPSDDELELTVTLSDNEYFVLGDNRGNSYDSRYFGPVDGSEIMFAIAGQNDFLNLVNNFLP